jgi:hypothetical protein
LLLLGDQSGLLFPEQMINRQQPHLPRDRHDEPVSLAASNQADNPFRDAIYDRPPDGGDFVVGNTGASVFVSNRNASECKEICWCYGRFTPGASSAVLLF